MADNGGMSKSKNPVGCPCGGPSYETCCGPFIEGGMVPAYELLINNSAVANLIRERRTHEIQTVIETGLEYGMIDMNRSLIDMVKKGEITVENAFAYSTNPKGLERLM